MSTSASAASAGAPAAATGQATPTHYDHVFVIMEENHGFSDVIGNPAAPNLNALAQQYGIATNYFGVAHPSEPNYVGLLGGDTYGVKDDNPYYLNKVNAPSLISQLDQAKLPWKAYLQGLPHAGYQGMCFPSNCNGAPDKDPLYVSKHNAIGNFTTSDNPQDWARQVPIEQLAKDLKGGSVPAFNYVIPDECHDQHGDPPFCLDSGSADGGVLGKADPQDQRLVATGDQYLGQLVQSITGAGFWAKGNNAIAVTYDEGNDSAQGGGQVATVLVTSHGPRGVQDGANYNHYSLLQTIQQNFGLGCLKNTCDTANVHPLTPMLASTGAKAVPFHAITPPRYATPTPNLTDPVTAVTNLPAKNGWSVQPAPQIGTADNTFGAVAAVAKDDVWAVGNFIPGAKGSNADATLSMAAHFDGTKWTSTPTVQTGSNFSTLFGVAATPGKAWAVGVALDKDFAAHSVIEAWDGKAWHLAPTPKLDTQRDILYSATAVNDHDVWAVGVRQSEDGVFGTLIEHFDGTAWRVVESPNPGSSGNQLYGVAADSAHDVYAVGQRDGQSSDTPLVLHWDGKEWSTVATPATPAISGAALLQGVSVRGGQVWAVGQSDDAQHQAKRFVLHLDHGGAWTAETPSGLGAAFSDVTGVTATEDGAWLVGTYFDATAGKQVPLLAKHDGGGSGSGGWHAVAAPDPGTGDTVFGGVASAGENVWAVGYAKTDAGRSPLIELHRG
jgi:hypothetical protein